MPASLKVYANVEVEYETMNGWTEDISKCIINTYGYHSL